jgi:hypothetical protein
MLLGHLERQTDVSHLRSRSRQCPCPPGRPGLARRVGVPDDIHHLAGEQGLPVRADKFLAPAAVGQDNMLRSQVGRYPALQADAVAQPLDLPDYLRLGQLLDRPAVEQPAVRPADRVNLSRVAPPLPAIPNTDGTSRRVHDHPSTGVRVHASCRVAGEREHIVTVLLARLRRPTCQAAPHHPDRLQGDAALFLTPERDGIVVPFQKRQ